MPEPKRKGRPPKRGKFGKVLSAEETAQLRAERLAHKAELRAARKAKLSPERRLSRAVGAKINGIRKGRGLTTRQLAEQLGVSYEYTMTMLKGRIIPGPEMQGRLLAWATQNVTFEHTRTLRNKWAANRKNKLPYRWRKVQFYMPPDVARALTALAQEHGYSRTTWILLAIQRLIKDELFVHSSKSAMDELSRLRMTAAINDNPMIRDVLEMDVDTAVAIGLQFPPKSALDAKVQESYSNLQNIAAIKVTPSGEPATKIAIEKDFWDERLDPV